MKTTNSRTTAATRAKAAGCGKTKTAARSQRATTKRIDPELAALRTAVDGLRASIGDLWAHIEILKDRVGAGVFAQRALEGHIQNSLGPQIESLKASVNVLCEGRRLAAESALQEEESAYERWQRGALTSTNPRSYANSR